jgi:RNA polymerase sigma-70 factor, ECF subfamily
MTEAEFEATVLAHQGMVYGVACRFCRNPAVAEEIAQDVFLQLFERRDGVGAGEHATRWLRRATAHRCIDLARRPATSAECAMAEVPDRGGGAPRGDILLHDRLRRLVASLPSTPRMIVILHYGEDLDAAEIARALDMPVRTVWSHLRRSIALLRAKVSRHLNEEIDVPVRR